MAKRLIQEHRFSEALLLLDKARARGPQDPDFDQMGGVCLAMLGRPAEAQERFTSAIAKKPDFAPYYFSSGLAASNADNLPLAEQRLAKALELDRNLPRAGLEYALVLAREEKWKDAEPVAMARIASSDLSHAEEPMLWRVAGRSAYMLKDWETTIKAYGELIRFDPKSSEALEAIGEALLGEGRTSESLPYLEKAAQLDPTDGNCERLLAFLSKELGDSDGELQHLKTAHRLLPEDYSTAYRLSRLLRSRGDTKDAEALQREISNQMRTNKDASESSLNAGRLNAEGMQFEADGRFAEALSKYEEASRTAPQITVFRRNQALLLCKQGRYSEAVPILKEILQEDPDDFQAEQILKAAVEQLQRR